MYFLIEEIQINLSFLMLAQIKEAAKRQRASLPYGMAFILIFSEFGVDLEGENSKRLLYTNYYSENSLHRIGYTKIGGQWVKKTSG